MLGNIVGVVHQIDVFSNIAGECGEFFESGVDACVEEVFDAVAGKGAVGGKCGAIVKDEAVCGAIFDMHDGEGLT